MKKFHFSMENLLSYKNQILDSELKILSDLKRQQQESLARMVCIEQNYEKCKASLDLKLTEIASPHECQLYLHYIGDLNTQKKAVRREIDRLDMRISEQIEYVREMKIEAKTLESLKESKLEEYGKAVLKKAELNMDEFISGTRVLKA